MSRTHRRGSIIVGPGLRLEVCEVWGPPAAAGLPDLAVQVYGRIGENPLYTLTLTPGQASALAALLTRPARVTETA